MRKFIHKVRDLFYDLNQYMWMLIISILVVGVLATVTYDMFTKDYTAEVGSSEEASTPVTTVEEELSQDIQVTIPEGSTFLDASKILVNANIIQDEEAFVKIIQEQGLEESILPGEYHFKLHDDPEQVLKAITGQ